MIQVPFDTFQNNFKLTEDLAMFSNIKANLINFILKIM